MCTQIQCTLRWALKYSAHWALTVFYQEASSWHASPRSISYWLFSISISMCSLFCWFWYTSLSWQSPVYYWLFTVSLYFHCFVKLAHLAWLDLLLEEEQGVVLALLSVAAKHPLLLLLSFLSPPTYLIILLKLMLVLFKGSSSMILSSFCLATILLPKLFNPFLQKFLVSTSIDWRFCVHQHFCVVLSLSKNDALKN